MEAERLRRIEELYHAALEHPAAERGAFLDQACSRDEPLRREVESLLAFESRAERFIETPALEATARALARDRDAAQLEGRRIGHYEIVSPLGEGGVGRVYLARDLQLGRRVALKFLDESFAQDAARLRRFEREARAASALSHPNILTVYATGSEAGMPFIVTELVEGQTLRQALAAGPMHPAEGLRVAIQIAEALGAAHAAGIVHRDIKPENVMLRPDGYVKVLDFGLAKLTEQTSQAEPGEDTSGPGSSGLTAPGAVLGTARYMSPEQARGAGVDARTDIFSLGVVLYEMLAGASPFDGATTTDVLAAILYREPEALASRGAVIPAELERIVARCLKKDRAERYAGVHELLRGFQSVRGLVEPPGSRAAHTAPAASGSRASSGLERQDRSAGSRSSRGRVAGAVAGVVLAAIAGAMLGLAGRLFTSDPASEPGRGLGDPAVQQLYRKGREAWNRRTAPGLRQALEYFEQASARDPTYAPAFAGLADCWSLLPSFGSAPPDQAAVRARESARRALELDDGLAEAHASFGLYLKDFDRDFDGAEQELRRAIVLDRGYAPARQWLAECLVALGRADEALESMRMAQELDPTSLVLRAQLGWVLYQMRRYDEAAEQLLDSADLDPGFPLTYFYLGRVYEQTLRFAEAASAARKASDLAGGRPLFLASLGHIHGLAGERSEAQRLLAELVEQARHRYVPPLAIALVHTGLGDRDQALEWMQTAYERRDTLLAYHLRDAQLDPLRPDPRFSELLRRFDLTPSRN
jgi:serine/threonine protein kinase/tetratricopeptide (TPR) repeat protein